MTWVARCTCTPREPYPARRHDTGPAASADPGPGRSDRWTPTPGWPSSPLVGRSASQTTRSCKGCWRGAASTSSCTVAGSTSSNATASSPSAESEHRAVLDELQQLYLVQLDHALRAMYAVAAARRRAAAHRQARAQDDAMAVVRLVDERHLVRVAAAQARVLLRLAPGGAAGGRTSTGRRCAQLLESAAGAGRRGRPRRGAGARAAPLPCGTVRPRAVVAWSAGAMALTERVVSVQRPRTRRDRPTPRSTTRVSG